MEGKIRTESSVAGDLFEFGFKTGFLKTLYLKSNYREKYKNFVEHFFNKSNTDINSIHGFIEKICGYEEYLIKGKIKTIEDFAQSFFELVPLPFIPGIIDNEGRRENFRSAREILENTLKVEFNKKQFASLMLGVWCGYFFVIEQNLLDGKIDFLKVGFGEPGDKRSWYNSDLLFWETTPIQTSSGVGFIVKNLHCYH